ncbi:hypothetical protein [Bacillus sp. OK048]|uniref:hypothetical protein n=1 Tax=Bacillus sp. OK048 TaxID=1882761 RepID=UPI00088CECDE|nr:hypothetical protein [Bacillus sp. OK048]SDM98654.1 hypothetical protein SAMN05443253_10760 [Bacillus sp. OK048]
MFENFEVNHLFEGTVHEHPHFSLSVEGNEYKGMIHGDKIHWYNPHPKQSLEEEHVSAIESQVVDMISDHLEQ